LLYDATNNDLEISIKESEFIYMIK